MPSLYGNTSSNYTVYSSSTIGLYATTSSAAISATVATSNLPGLYSGVYGPLPSNVQTILNFFDSNGNVGFGLDPITGNTTIIANANPGSIVTPGNVFGTLAPSPSVTPAIVGGLVEFNVNPSLVVNANNVFNTFDNNGLVQFSLDTATNSSTILATVNPDAVFSVSKAREAVSGGYGIAYSTFTGVIAISNTFTQSSLVNGTWTVALSSSGTVTLPYYQLPPNTGTYNQALFTNGVGQTYWNTVSNYSTATVDVFTSNGVQQNFTLSQTPINLSYFEVSVGGVVQTQIDSYTVSGNTLSFVEAPPSGVDFVQARYYTILTAVPVPGIPGPRGDTGTFATTASTSIAGIIKVGANLSISGDGTLSGLNSYVLPTATTSTLGGITASTGTTVDLAGYLSVVPATGGTLGGVKIGAGIGLASDGTISVTTASFALSTATAYALGGIKVGANLNITADGTLSGVNSYSLPTATNITLGGVKIGLGLGASADGTISVTAVPTLTTATSSVVGGIKIGSNLTITADGTLSALNSYVLTTATNTALGGVKIQPENGIGIDPDGTLYITQASTTNAGVVSIIPLSGIYVDSLGEIGFNLTPINGTGTNAVLTSPTSSDGSGKGSFTFNLIPSTYGHLGGIQLLSGQPFITDGSGNLYTKNGAGISLDGSGALTLTTATTSTIGGIKVGVGITGASDGTVNLNTATTSTLGGIKAGLNTTITSDGTLNITSATLIGLPTANQTTLGGIYGLVNYSIALGKNAGAVNQAPNYATAIGNGAGQFTQTQYAVSLGVNAGNSSQAYGAVAIGGGAGGANQGQYGIALGFGAGTDNQSTGSIAIGYNAGSPGATNTAGQGQHAIAIGYGVAQSDYVGYAQGHDAIAIGTQAALHNQGPNAIAIGQGAGTIDQGAGAIAIGQVTGYYDQGAGSIAIGSGILNPSGQPANSIIISATDSLYARNYTNTGTYITPIRSDVSTSATAYTLFYNTNTAEVTYSSLISTGFVNTGTYVGFSDLNVTWGWGGSSTPNLQLYIKSISSSTYQIIPSTTGISSSTGVTLSATSDTIFLLDHPFNDGTLSYMGIPALPVKLWNTSTNSIYEIDIATYSYGSGPSFHQPAFIKIEKLA